MGFITSRARLRPFPRSDIHSGLRGPVGLGRAALSSRLWPCPGLPASDAFTISRRNRRQRGGLGLRVVCDNRLPQTTAQYRPDPFDPTRAAESDCVGRIETSHGRILSVPSAQSGRVAFFRGCRRPESSRCGVAGPCAPLALDGFRSPLRSFARRSATRSVRSWRPRADRSSCLAPVILTRRASTAAKRSEDIVGLLERSALVADGSRSISG